MDKRPPAPNPIGRAIGAITDFARDWLRRFVAIQGIDRANKTLRNVKGAWVKDQEVTVDNGKVSGYKVVLKVTFILTD